MSHHTLLLTLLFLVSYGSSPAQNEVSIDVNGGIEYVVIDPLGRKEGIDPITNHQYREINNSYGEFSVDSEDPDYDPPEPYNEFMTYEPIEGLYHLTLYGTRAARYRIFIVVRSQDKGQGIEFYGMIDSNQVRILEFNYSSDSSKTLVLKKIITGTSLREHLSNCFKLGFIGGRSLFKQLDEKVRDIERRLERKDSSKAFQELGKFAEELSRIWTQTEQRGQKKKLNRFILKEAYDILSEDAAILMSTLSPGKHRKEDEKNGNKGHNDGQGDRKKSDHDKH